MPGARQPLYPPYVIGKKYKLLSTNNNSVNILVTYVGLDETGTLHQFEHVNQQGTIVSINAANINSQNPPDPIGLYIVGEGNAGGRRKSRRSKRKLRRTKRKARRHH